jgi:hypothetical protein
MAKLADAGTPLGISAFRHMRWGMKRIIGGGVVTLLLSTTAVLQAITFGQPDAGEHPFVGTLLFETATGYYSCSGTLMSPTVVLTAGHCTEEAGVTNLNTWVTFAESVDLSGLSSYPSIAAFFDDPANGWIRADVVPHPEFDDFSEFPATFDIGLAILRTPVDMDTYGELPDENFLTTIRRRQQDRFTAVGYGLQGEIKPFFGDEWARYKGSVRLIEVNSTFNAGMTAKFTNNPGTGGGTCFGDSGGPIFYGETNVVVAVVSFGVTPCIGTGYHFRTDTALAQDFIRPYLE